MRDGGHDDRTGSGSSEQEAFAHKSVIVSLTVFFFTSNDLFTGPREFQDSLNQQSVAI